VPDFQSSEEGFISPEMMEELRQYRMGRFQQINLRPTNTFPFPPGWTQSGPTPYNPYQGLNNGFGGGSNLMPVIGAPGYSGGTLPLPPHPGAPGANPGPGVPDDDDSSNAGGSRFSCVSGFCVQHIEGAHQTYEDCMLDGCQDGGAGSSVSIVIPVSITGSSGPSVSDDGYPFYAYGWTEVEWDGSNGFSVKPSGKNSGTYGAAFNTYEVTADEDGGNVFNGLAPTIVRLVIPSNHVVLLLLRQDGYPLFYAPSPIELTCSNPVNLLNDGGSY